MTKRPKNKNSFTKKRLDGYIAADDLKNYERLKSDLFEDLGPKTKNQFYFVGEMGEDSEVKHMSGAQKKQFFAMHKKTQ